MDKYERFRENPKTFRTNVWRYISDPYQGGDIARYFSRLLQAREINLARKAKDILSSSAFKGVLVVTIVSLSVTGVQKDNENTILEAFIDNLEAIGIASTAIIFMLEIPDRRKQYHYQAWQVISSSREFLNKNNLSPSSGRVQALQDLVIDNVDLKGVSVPCAILTGIKLRYGKLENSDFEGAQLNSSDLRDTDFSGANLSGANLQDAQLMNSRLVGANLSGADLRGADLSNANLHSANLQKADMRFAILKNAVLKFTKMQDGFIGDSDLESADLRGANLERVTGISEKQLNDAMLCGTVLPDGIKVDQIHCTVVEVQVSGDSAEVTKILYP